jgi:hypothetical protein
VAAVELTPDDLTPFAVIETAKAQAMIDDALALAALVAPCITDDDFAYATAAKAILRGAILRWNEAGSGALQAQTAGPFGVTMDNRQQRRGMFWPSEIEQLQQLCIDGNPTGGAFEIDTLPSTATGVYGVDYWWTGPDSTSTIF